MKMRLALLSRLCLEFRVQEMESRAFRAWGFMLREGSTQDHGGL